MTHCVLSSAIFPKASLCLFNFELLEDGFDGIRQTREVLAKMASGDMESLGRAMGAIFATMGAVLAASNLTLTRKKLTKRTKPRGAAVNLSKRRGEAICLKLAAVWIAAVVVVIATQAYESWGPWGYMGFCTPCALLYVTVPYIFPGKPHSTPFLLPPSNVSISTHEEKAA